MNKEKFNNAIIDCLFEANHCTDIGYPISAVVLDKNYNVIIRLHDENLKSKDIFSHVELVAIRKASLKLNTNDLSKCILITSCKPCFYCLNIIKFFKLKNIYYFLDINDYLDYFNNDNFFSDYNNTVGKSVKTGIKLTELTNPSHKKLLISYFDDFNRMARYV